MKKDDRLTIQVNLKTPYAELRNFYIYRLLTCISNKQPYRPDAIPDYYNENYAFLHIPTTKMGKEIVPDMYFLSYFYSEFTYKNKTYRKESYIDQKTAHLEMAMAMVVDMISDPYFFE